MGQSRVAGGAGVGGALDVQGGDGGRDALPNEQGYWRQVMSDRSG